MSQRNRVPEPCLCGDPECGRCFPQPYPEQNPDDAYDEKRQQDIDDREMKEKGE